MKSRTMRWAGHAAHMGMIRNPHMFLVGRSKEERPLGKPTRRWEENTEMDLREIGFGGSCLHSYGSGQGTAAGCCAHDNESSS